MKELREPTIKASRQEVNALIHLNSCKSTELEKDSRLYLLWRLSLGTILGGTIGGQVAASREGAASHGLVAHPAPLTHSLDALLAASALHTPLTTAQPLQLNLTAEMQQCSAQTSLS